MSKMILYRREKMSFIWTMVTVGGLRVASINQRLRDKTPKTLEDAPSRRHGDEVKER